MSGIFDKSIDVLSKALDLYLARHSVISDNIANAETPFYKARRIDFEAALQRAIDVPEGNQIGRDIASVNPVIYEDPESEVGLDLNTVDMDREMAELSKNDVKFSAASQAISKKFALLKYAISGGGER